MFKESGNELTNETRKDDSEQKEENGENSYDLNAANEQAVTSILSVAQVRRWYLRFIEINRGQF